jgi:hypothetical protein
MPATTCYNALALQKFTLKGDHMPGKRSRIVAAIAILCLGLAGWGSANAQAPDTKAAPQAPDTKAAPQAPPDPAKILREMTDYLKSLKQFSFRADITDDQVYAEGNKLQYSLDMEVFVRRPDKLRVNGQGDLENQELFYDGKNLTVYHKDTNLYATAPMPPTIEEALNKAYREFDLQVAVADLVCGNAYEFLMDDVISSLYVGLNLVRGVKCHHLAFNQDDFNWQIWVEAGDKPLPRKLLVTQKRLAASPQWTAYLTDWNFSPELADSLFTFGAPAEARRIEFLPPPQAETKPKPRGPKKGQKP